MFRNLKCIKNKVNKGCKRREVKEIIYKISKNNNKLNIINRCQNNLKRCLESEDIDKILEFKIDKIKEYNLDYDDRDIKRNSLCKFNPDVCDINIKLENTKLDKLNKEVKEKINLYNDDLVLLEKLKKHYEKSNNVSKDIYIKFTRDKKNNLIGVYFDIEDFVNTKQSTVYLFSKNQEFYNPSVLFLRYDDFLKYGPKEYINKKDNGYVLIGDIRVYEKRIGHGTFMLSNIEPILKKVNKRIRYKNRNIDYYDREMNEIVAVNGMVCPGSDTTYEDLVKFYNQNGYPTYDTKNVKNRNLYKEI